MLGQGSCMVHERVKPGILGRDEVDDVEDLEELAEKTEQVSRAEPPDELDSWEKPVSRKLWGGESGICAYWGAGTAYGIVKDEAGRRVKCEHPRIRFLNSARPIRLTGLNSNIRLRTRSSSSDSVGSMAFR